MTQFTKWALVVAGVVGLVALVMVPRRLRAGERVLVVGDSLTGSPGYCDTLRKALNKELLCISKTGAGIKDIHSTAMSALIALEPSTVVVLAGVNDLASGRSLEYITTALDEFYQDLDRAGAKVVAVTLTPWSGHNVGSSQKMQEDTRTLNAWIKSHPVPAVVVDTSDLTGQGKDGLHLTRVGGEQLAKLVLQRLS